MAGQCPHVRREYRSTALEAATTVVAVAFVVGKEGAAVSILAARYLYVHMSGWV